MSLVTPFRRLEELLACQRIRKWFEEDMFQVDEKGEPKRPPNSFIIFKMVSSWLNIRCDVQQAWRNLCNEERMLFYQAAEHLKEEHARAHPGYTFKPNRQRKDGPPYAQTGRTALKRSPTPMQKNDVDEIHLHPIEPDHFRNSFQSDFLTSPLSLATSSMGYGSESPLFTTSEAYSPPIYTPTSSSMDRASTFSAQSNPNIRAQDYSNQGYDPSQMQQWYAYPAASASPFPPQLSTYTNAGACYDVPLGDELYGSLTSVPSSFHPYPSSSSSIPYSSSPSLQGDYHQLSEMAFSPFPPSSSSTSSTFSTHMDRRDESTMTGRDWSFGTDGVYASSRP